MVDERCPQCDCPMRLHHVGFNKRYMCFERMSNDNNDFCGCTYGAPPKATLTLYVIRNSKGEFFRAKGRHNTSKKSWVPDLIDARLYTKVSQARSKITFFANNYPNLPVPELIELNATETRVIDENDRVKEAKRKKELELENRKKARAKLELEAAHKQLAAAQAKINRLMKG